MMLIRSDNEQNVPQGPLSCLYTDIKFNCILKVKRFLKPFNIIYICIYFMMPIYIEKYEANSHRKI